MKKKILITFFILIVFFHFDVFGMIVSIKPDGLPAEKVNFIFRSAGNVESIVVTSPDGITYEAKNNTENKITIYMENAPAGNYKIDIRGDFTTFSVSIVPKTTSTDSQPDTRETNEKQTTETMEKITSTTVSETSVITGKSEKQPENQNTTETKQTISSPGETTININKETIAGITISPNTTNNQNQSVKQKNTETKENKMTERAIAETDANNTIFPENDLQEIDGIDTTLTQEITTEAVASEWIPVITIPETGLWHGNIVEENESKLGNTNSRLDEEFIRSESKPINLNQQPDLKPNFFFRIFFSFILYFSVSCFAGAGIRRKKANHIF